MISIIIPIYNGEKYIDRCLNVLGKIKEDIEVILINDGSTDKTNQKLQKYNNNDNIKIIEQENSGVSVARNKGLDIVKGDYVMFCDIDDYYDENVISCVKDELAKKKPDLLIFGRKDIQGEKIICKYPIAETKDDINNVEYLENFFCNGKHTYIVSNKVYKREIIQKNNVRFNPKFIYSEDTLFNLEYITYCKKISVAENCYYMRTYNEGSAIYKKHNNFYFENTKIIEQFSNYVKNKKLYKKSINELYKHYSLVAIYRICDGIDKQNKKKDIKNIKKIVKDIKYRKVEMNNAKGIQNKILYLLIKTQQSALIYFIFSYIRGKYIYYKHKKSNTD